jgi:hypothetical protein
MTVRENMIPSAMVPGLVTIEDEKGRRQNVYPVDAKELINSGEYTLVENGAVEAARIAATPLRSGMAAGIPSDQIVAEISGVAGRVVMADSPKEADAAQKAGENADNVPNKSIVGSAAQSEDKKAAESGKTGDNKSGAADKK